MDSDWAGEFRDFLISSSHLKENDEAPSFIIHGSTLVDSCPSTFSTLLLNPIHTLEICDRILSEVSGRSRQRLRLSSLPPLLELIRQSVPRSSECGYFLSFSGTVVKTGSVKLMEWLREFTCKKCGTSETFKAEFEMYQAFNPPRNCPSCNAGPNSWKNNQKGGQLKPEYCKDYQEIKVQEQIQNLGLGTVPRSVWVALEDDIVDSCKPGDDVLVIGTVCRRWKALGKGLEERTDIELVFRANFIQVQNDDKSKFHLSHESVEEFQKFWKKYERRRLIGRNVILSSFCPQVYGLFIVKLAVAVVLAGGVERIDETGTRVRGEPHLLMVGDPGTGKSQILKYASRLSQRSVMTTGMGSTSAGLTVSASKAGGVWNLEAGALVLADGGICCIDEFNGIREADRACIHEAMEQQSLSIAKAGLVCKLQTRCSVLAAANPKGSYNPDEPLSVNIAVASPLLSRFDLVLILMDLKNEKWDEMVSSYLLNGQKPFEESKDSKFWTLDALRSYFSYTKSINPTIHADVSQIISRYYQRQRCSEHVNISRTTVRLLQSIVRLSQGHARLLHHSRVEILDVVNAILLIEASGGVPSSSSLIINNSTNTLQSSFPANPLADYYEHARSVLLGLNLPELWEAEEERLKKVAENEISLPSEFDQTFEENESLSLRAKKDENNMILTQVKSKLKNKFSFVETVLPKRKKRKVPLVRSGFDSDSSSSDDEPKSSTLIANKSAEIKPSSDESDFEPTTREFYKKDLKLGKDPSSNVYETKPKKGDNLAKLCPSNLSMESKKSDDSLDIIFNEACDKLSRSSSSLSDLDLSLNDEGPKSLEKNVPNTKINDAPIDVGTSRNGEKRKGDSPEARGSAPKQSRSFSPQKNTNNKSEKDEIHLSNKTLNRFKQFSAPSSSPECSQPKVSLADIFSQSQDEDLDLDI